MQRFVKYPGSFPYDDFIEYFPEFSPDKEGQIKSLTPEFLQACGKRASLYLSNYDSVWLNGERRIYAHCLLTAHIVYLTNKVQSEVGNVDPSGKFGETTVGPVTSTGVGGVSISMQTPSFANDGAFESWLVKSPYGQEFLAMIRTRGPAITFIGSTNSVLPLR